MATDRLTAAMNHLSSSVTQGTTVVDSAIRLISGLASQIRALKDQPDALESLALALDQKTAALAEAVATNTIAEGQEQPSTPTPSTPAVPSVPGEAGVSPVDANVDAGDIADSDTEVAGDTEVDELEDDAEDATDMEDDATL